MKVSILAMLLFAFAAAAQEQIQIQRLEGNPLIRPDMVPKDDGEWSGNLNFPSIIRVPAWIEKPLGKYYLYFSAHHGTYIRMAYADRVEGPWTVYEKGTLRLDQVEAANAVTERIPQRHVASPDVHVDDTARQIRMYFHFLLPKLGHRSSVAFSTDGLSFEPRAGTIGDAYLRVFQREGAYWAIDQRGVLSRSPDGVKDFATVSEAVKKVADGGQKSVSFRHGGVEMRGDELLVYFSRIGDTPERILMTRVTIKGDPAAWTATEPVELLRPELDWEGAGFELKASTFTGQTNVRQLRDPFVFAEDGNRWLFYSVAGETGIAAARLSVAR